MRRALAIALGLAVVAGGAWAARSVAAGGGVDTDALRALVHAHDPYGPAVFVALGIAAVFLHLPEMLLIGAGGVVFGALPAFAYGWVACVIGTTATFVLVRYLARDAFQRTLHRRFPRLVALDERLARHGFRTVLLLRVFLFAAPPLNWGLGATRLRLPHYVAGTALGIVPGVGTAAFFGDAVAAGKVAPPSAPVVAVAVAAAALLAVAAVLGRRLLGRTAG